MSPINRPDLITVAAAFTFVVILILWIVAIIYFLAHFALYVGAAQ